MMIQRMLYLILFRLAGAGKPEDVANAAVFLAKNSYITGQVLNVDGGMIM